MQDTRDHQADTAAAPLWSLSNAEVLAALHTAHQSEKNAAALKARLVAESIARDLPAKYGHRSVPRWLQEQLLIDPYPAGQLTAQAAALRAHPSLEQALVDGRIDVLQTVVIADTLAEIPAHLNAIPTSDAIPVADGGLGPDPAAGSGPPDRPTIAAAAEATLIDWAARLPAWKLRRAGNRILAHVAPEVADSADEAILRHQERRAHQTRSFTLSRPVNGVVRLTGTLDVESAAVVGAALQPLCRPIPGDDRSPRQQRADALVEVCRLALHTGGLPADGGEPAQVTVTVAFDPLSRALRAGGFDNGERVSAQTGRRIACDAKILPLVLGGDSQVLDAGRSRRLANGPLRRALAVRDKGCAFPDCDRPPRWTDAHHLTSWTDGGPTSLNNLVLLCRHHHRLLHEPAHGWQARLGPEGLPEFIPPPWVDPTRRSRRNLYHPRI